MIKLSDTHYRVDATGFPSKADALLFSREYGRDHRDYLMQSPRHYTGEGWFVFMDIGNGCFRWLKATDTA